MLHALLLVVAAACPPNTFCNTSGPPTTGVLLGASNRAPDDAWVVGDRGVARHWDGSSWTMSATGSDDRLHTVLSLGVNDAWALGYSTLLRFDGAWHPVPLEQPARGSFGALVQPRPDAIWVLGSGPLQLEGGQLKPLEGPASTFGTGGTPIDAVACGPDDVWALVRTEPGLTLHHWNGTDVRVLRQPFRMQVGSIVCVDHVAWVSTDDSVLSCTRAGCKAVSAPKRPRLLTATFGPLLLSGDVLFLWRKDRFQPLGDVGPDLLAGAARSLDDVLLVGAHGATEWFKGSAAARPPRPVRMPYLLGVAATSDGKAWALSNQGLFAFASERWSRDETFPGKLDDRESLAIWASSSSDVWVVAEGHAWRFNGSTWRQMTDTSVKTTSVWGRGPNEVYTFSEKALRRWNGTAWADVAPVKPGLTGQSISGTGTKVFALTKAPAQRFQRTGGESELIVLEQGKATTQVVPAELNTVVSAGGSVWGCSDWSAYRQTPTQWERVDELLATNVVATPQGALFFGETTATEWNGKTFTKVPLPGPVAAGVSVGPIVWLVGDETALRRTP